MNALLSHLPTEAKRAGSTSGGEYATACPWCGAGEDRLRVWPNHPDEPDKGKCWCRQCGRGGDGITLLRKAGLTFGEACRAVGLDPEVVAEGQGAQRPAQAAQRGNGGDRREGRKPAPQPPSLLRPPGEAWQRPALAFVRECRQALWEDTGAARSALRYLTGRGFTRRTTRAAGLGLNKRERRPARADWGLDPREEGPPGVWLPRGIVIPWWNRSEEGGPLWKVNIRRPAGDVEKRGGPKYVQAAGRKAGEGPAAPPWSTNALYGASALRSGRPAVLVEGELDALAIMQEARTGRFEEGAGKGRPLVAAVATGSTGAAREARWIGRLASCRPAVLVAFDAEETSAQAVAYWQRLFGQGARRHAPEGAKDAAAMLEAGEDLRGWIRAGLPDATKRTEPIPG